ncbi:preprotein translocase subunit YajC [Carboxydothermus islandicus]|uniref:Preprotein translocase subunit YajC n=1 Tax=Carboxydothermus islandicus TaxID=661089 RepID=A0A1L8D1I9_9THEO|nr:preprotein translocase subunit YajC [Carboxydothermus islandicus]GAV25055.1 preprotein translocase subunit YajC [Carboxydothermus islandicus]
MSSKIFTPQVVTIIYLVVFFLIVYFFMIRPQNQRQKQHQEFLKALKVDDRVLTVGGLIGEVIKIKEKTVILRLSDNVKVEILKSAITGPYKE